MFNKQRSDLACRELELRVADSFKFLKNKSPLESTEPAKVVWVPSSEQQKHLKLADAQGDTVHQLSSEFHLTPQWSNSKSKILAQGVEGPD